MAQQSKLINKILQKAGHENLIDELTARLSQSEIANLVLALLKAVTECSMPVDVLRRYESNRFTRPSRLDAVRILQVELEMLEMAAAMDFQPVLLSPAAQLGSCAVLAGVDQNNVVPASRGLELLADGTNMLALHVAQGIREGSIDNRSKPLHLCACSRVTRAQMVDSDELVPHFSMMMLVSSGRDKGSYQFEKEALAQHLAYYVRYYGETGGHALQVHLNARSGYTDTAGLLERVHAHLAGEFPQLEFVLNDEVPDNRYYRGLNFKMHIDGMELVDGGFVDWTQKLLGNRKERFLISATGVDIQFLTGLME